MNRAKATTVVVLTDASGSGKSAIARRLTGMDHDTISMHAYDTAVTWPARR